MKIFPAGFWILVGIPRDCTIATHGDIPTCIRRFTAIFCPESSAKRYRLVVGARLTATATETETETETTTTTTTTRVVDGEGEELKL